MAMRTSKTEISGSAVVTISKSTIDLIRPAEKEFIVFDESLTGFGVRVQPTGSMSFIVQYRIGSGRSGQTKKFTIAKTSKVAPDEARKIARDVLADVVKGGDPAKDKANDRRAVTFSALVSDYLEHVKSKKKQATYELYSHWLDLALPTLGKRKAIAITSSDVDRLHRSLESTPPTANRVLSTISSMYTWGMGTAKIIPKMENPAQGVEKFKEQPRERYLSSVELGRLGDAIREAETVGIPWDPAPGENAKHAPKEKNRRTKIDPWAAAALRLFILTGARRGEILKLKWDNVDLERGLLFLDDSKTDKKTIILNAPARMILEDLPRAGKFVIPGKPKIREGTNKAEDRPRSDLKRPWLLVRKRAGLDASSDDPDFRVRIHDLRHTHASVGVGSSLGLPIIGKLLGHTQARTTQRYAHLADDPTRQASELIGSKIFDAMGENLSPKDNVISLRKGGNS